MNNLETQTTLGTKVTERRQTEQITLHIKLKRSATRTSPSVRNIQCLKNKFVLAYAYSEIKNSWKRNISKSCKIQQCVYLESCLTRQILQFPAKRVIEIIGNLGQLLPFSLTVFGIWLAISVYLDSKLWQNFTFRNYKNS